MRSAAKRFLQFTDEPFLHGPHLEAILGKGRHEPDGRETAASCALAPTVIHEEHLARRFPAVQVHNHRRVFNADGFDDVKINRIPIAPYYLPALPSICVHLVNLSRRRWE